MSDTESTKTGARMNLSHLRRVRKERRKNKVRGVPLDSSLLMGDPSDDPSEGARTTPIREPSRLRHAYPIAS